MAIDYAQLFASNHFTRAQCEILRKLVELAIANGGGSGVSDPLKADKSVLLIADSGLTGGGDLSANRHFGVDYSVLDARYPVLSNGQVAASVIPPAAIHDTFVVADEAAMLALSAADPGDYAVRQDTGGTFVLKQTPASTLANWVLLPAASGVSTFNGRSGAIVPTTGDYSFAQIGSKPTTLAGYGITDAEPAFAAGTSAQYRRGDKTWQTLDKTVVGLGNVDNTADNSKPLGTTQLATLAAGTGAGLVGYQSPGTGAAVRPVSTHLSELAISLGAFAVGDGTTDDTTATTNWLNALAANHRRGYVPKGTYLVDTLALITDNLDVECHPEAKFLGKALNTLGSELAASATSGSWNNLLNGGAAGTITGDGSGLHAAGANNLAGWTYNVTLEDNTQYEITWTMANRTAGGSRVLVYGPTNNHVGVSATHSVDGTYTERVTTSGNSTTANNQIRIQCTGGNGSNNFDITAISVKKVNAASASPLLTLTSSAGTSTAPVGTVRWKGGIIDTSLRSYTNESDAVGLKLVNYGAASVRDAEFLGATDHETAAANAVAGSGLRAEACNNLVVAGCHFRGHQDAGLAVVGGTLAGTTDDGLGASITGNHFNKCNFGWKATRQSRNVTATGNSYRQCYVGATALDANSVNAGRVSIRGESFLKCGRAAIDVKQQNGAVIANCTIIDTGYKLDGTTVASGTIAAITLDGCIGVLVNGNVIRMDALTAVAGSFGIHNATYSAINPSNNVVSANAIASVASGIYDDGLGTANRYFNNTFASDVTTGYDTVPAAFAPYGTYTPTVTATTNVAAVTANTSSWRRIEKDITVNVFLTIDPTASGAGEVAVSIPVDPGADFTSDQDLLGVAASGIAGASGHFIADTTAGARKARLLCLFGTDVTNHSWTGSFAYRMAGDSTATPPPAGGDQLVDEANNPLTDESGNLLTM